MAKRTEVLIIDDTTGDVLLRTVPTDRDVEEFIFDELGFSQSNTTFISGSPIVINDLRE